MVGVPDLKVESRGNLGFGLVPREDVVLARDDNLLLGDEVVERKHEPPVEVAFARQRPNNQRQLVISSHLLCNAEIEVFFVSLN